MADLYELYMDLEKSHEQLEKLKTPQDNLNVDTTSSTVLHPNSRWSILMNLHMLYLGTKEAMDRCHHKFQVLQYSSTKVSFVCHLCDRNKMDVVVESSASTSNLEINCDVNSEDSIDDLLRDSHENSIDGSIETESVRSEVSIEPEKEKIIDVLGDRNNETGSNINVAEPQSDKQLLPVENVKDREIISKGLGIRVKPLVELCKAADKDASDGTNIQEVLDENQSLITVDASQSTSATVAELCEVNTQDNTTEASVLQAVVIDEREDHSTDDTPQSSCAIILPTSDSSQQALLSTPSPECSVKSSFVSSQQDSQGHSKEPQVQPTRSTLLTPEASLSSATTINNPTLNRPVGGIQVSSSHILPRDSTASSNFPNSTWSSENRYYNAIPPLTCPAPQSPLPTPPSSVTPNQSSHHSISYSPQIQSRQPQAQHNSPLLNSVASLRPTESNLVSTVQSAAVAAPNARESRQASFQYVRTSNLVIPVTSQSGGGVTNILLSYPAISLDSASETATLPTNSSSLKQTSKGGEGPSNNRKSAIPRPFSKPSSDRRQTRVSPANNASRNYQTTISSSVPANVPSVSNTLSSTGYLNRPVSNPDVNSVSPSRLFQINNFANWMGASNNLSTAHIRSNPPISTSVAANVPSISNTSSSTGYLYRPVSTPNVSSVSLMAASNTFSTPNIRSNHNITVEPISASSGVETMRNTTQPQHKNNTPASSQPSTNVMQRPPQIAYFTPVVNQRGQLTRVPLPAPQTGHLMRTPGPGGGRGSQSNIFQTTNSRPHSPYPNQLVNYPRFEHPLPRGILYDPRIQPRTPSSPNVIRQAGRGSGGMVVDPWRGRPKRP
jgi:hypothetical protein